MVATKFAHNMCLIFLCLFVIGKEYVCVVKFHSEVKESDVAQVRGEMKRCLYCSYMFKFFRHYKRWWEHCFKDHLSFRPSNDN